MTDVEWRPAPGFPRYQVSSEGRVRSSRFPDRELKLSYRAPDGRPQITLSRDGQPTVFHLHRLVALTFLGPKPDWVDVVRHLNDDRHDNRAANLAYGTHSDNQHDLIRNGRNPYSNRTHCRHGHPYDEANTYWGRDGRKCRACGRIQKARSVA